MTTSAQRSLRVLIVEDDAIISMLLAELLAELGYDVCATAATEAEAVAAAIRDKPDLMIVDARLRGGSGVSAVAEILQAGRSRIFSSAEPQGAFGRSGRMPW
jgi:two-component system, response regulator PdtaR